MTLKRFSFKLICIYYLGKSRWTSENNFKSGEKNSVKLVRAFGFYVLKQKKKNITQH